MRKGAFPRLEAAAHKVTWKGIKSSGTFAEARHIYESAMIAKENDDRKRDTGSRFWNCIYIVKMMGTRIHSVPGNPTVRYKLATPPRRLSVSKPGR